MRQQQLIRQSKGKAMVDEKSRHAEVQARARNGWANGFKLELDKEYLDNKGQVCPSSFLHNSYLYNSPPACTVWRQICLTGEKYIGECTAIGAKYGQIWRQDVDKEGRSVLQFATEQLAILVFKGSSGGHKNMTKPVKHDFLTQYYYEGFLSVNSTFDLALCLLFVAIVHWHWFQYLLLSHVEDVASIWLWDQKNLNTRLCFLMIWKSVALYLTEFFILRKLARMYYC